MKTYAFNIRKDDPISKQGPFTIYADDDIQAIEEIEKLCNNMDVSLHYIILDGKTIYEA